MSRFQTEFARIGGPGAVTWWAFWISLIDRLVTVSVQPTNTAAPWAVRLLCTVAAQLVMFAPLVLLRFTLLRDPLRPRPWVALAGFAFGAVLRGLVVDRLLHEFGGLPLLPELRVFSGFLPTIIPLLVTAYVVNTVREHHRDLTALLALRDQLQRSRLEAEEAVQARNTELVQRVRTVLESELAALSQESPEEVVAGLQRTATDVIRPLSHELANTFAEREGPEVAQAPVRVSWLEVVGGTSDRYPLRPLLTALVLSGVMLSAAAVFSTIRLQLVLVLGLIVIVLAGVNLVLRPLLPRVGPAGRFALILGGALASGLVVGGLVLASVGDWPSAQAVAIAVLCYVTGVGGGLAIVSGVLAARSVVLSETTIAVDELRRQVLRTRQLQWFHQRGLARALHGPVQSVVTAAALRLDEASRTGGLSSEVVESVHQELIRTLDVLADPDPSIMSIEAGIDRIIGTWDGVCAVTAGVDENAKSTLADDAVTRASVLDIITDATSNAVRHGRATHVGILLTCDVKTLVIDVRDDGPAPLKATRSGLGTTLLDDCALSWSLIQDDRGHRLHVLLPTP